MEEHPACGRRTEWGADTHVLAGVGLLHLNEIAAGIFEVHLYPPLGIPGLATEDDTQLLQPFVLLLDVIDPEDDDGKPQVVKL
jgi:hypothetical protein